MPRSLSTPHANTSAAPAESRATRCDDWKPSFIVSRNVRWKKGSRDCQARGSFVLRTMDAPESAPADTLALPDAPPVITLGQALPFALAFEARRRQAADRRAARKLQRLKDTLRQCGELRARLAALCDAATAAAASGDDAEDARDGRISANAARELMLVAARGASRARGEPHEGKHAAILLEKEVFATENTNASSATRATGTASPRVSRLGCVACGARASEASEAFAFVREARAFRLAELALAATERPDSGRPEGSARAASLRTFSLPVKKGAAEAEALLRGADDPPASFAAGTLLLELVGASHESDERAHSTQEVYSEKNPEKNSNHPMNQPLLPFGLAGAARAEEATRRVFAAARGFARALERAAAPRSPGSRDAPGTRVTQRTSPPVSPAGDGGSFFRREPSRHAFADDALRRDVLAALIASAAPRSGPENGNMFFGGVRARRARAVDPARLARVALREAAATDALAADALALCASRIREGVVALRERRGGLEKKTTRDAATGTATARDGVCEDVSGETFFLRGEATGDSNEPSGTFFESARARRTLDEFEECQRLGFVFSVAERAAQKLRASMMHRPAAETNGPPNGVEAARARAALDAVRAAAEAATAPDHADGSKASKPPESIAVRLIGARAIRLHAMVCVALGRKAQGTPA